MRWIRTVDGDRDHAVPTGATKTLCNIPLSAAAQIMHRPTNRCGTCDYRWREKGLAQRRKSKPSSLSDYEPVFTYDDWEKQQ
jgi:hypothetical protein